MKRFGKWLLQSRARLGRVTAATLLVTTTAGMVVLYGRVQDIADLIPTAASTTSPTPTGTTSVPRMTLDPIETFRSVEPYEAAASEAAVQEIVLAWLQGDPELAGRRHPVLLRTVPAVPPGLALLGPPRFAVEDGQTLIYDVPSTAGDVTVGVMSTDEAGWVATLFTAPS